MIFGTMDIKEEKMNQAIKAAANAGYELIDTAWIYQNEASVGAALKAFERETNQTLKLQTKIWTDHFDNVREQFMSQLAALQVKKVYSVLLHRPSINFYQTIDAWKELIKLQQEGYIEKIGVSNFDKDMINILVKETNVKPWANQVELSVINFRDDRIAYAKEHEIEIQAWSPMGNDLLALNNAKVQAIAKELSCTNAQVALAYLTNQGIKPVVKSQTPANIASNIKAEQIKLSDEQIKQLKCENKFITKFEDTYPY